MKNSGSKYIVIIFALLLAAPLLNGVLHIVRFDQKDENRVFKTMPEADIHKLDRFPVEFDAYYNDNFSFRTPLLEALHKIKYYGFHISPNPDQTVIGKEGWNYLAEKEKKVFEGDLNFTKGQLDTLYHIWNNRLTYFKQQNIKCYWLIAPTKHRVYPEFLPDNFIQPKGPSRVEVLSKFLNGKFPGLIIDPTEALLKAKKDHKLFYQLDNHWNFNAGFIASDLLYKRIKQDFPSVIAPTYDNYIWKDTITSFGYHKNVIGVESLTEKEQVVYNKKELAIKAWNYNFPVIEHFPYPWDYEHRYINYQADSTMPRILVIRDSFGAQMIPFLKEGFRESEFIFDSWHYWVDKGVIEKYDPDMIIYISLETHIESLIDNNNLW